MLTADCIKFGSPRLLVPGPAALGAEPEWPSNNNLDACEHAGRRYLAWRTSPTHFASERAAIHIASTSDGDRWRHEHTIELGCDVREPRFFRHHGVLHLFFFNLGSDWRHFEPDRIHVTMLERSGWTAATAISETDCVVWRVRYVNDVPLMTIYRGAGRLYSLKPETTTVEFWTTVDGVAWRPLNSDQPVAHRGGTETEVLAHPDHGYIAVTRKEGPTSFGSDIAHFETLDSQSWRTRSVPQKLDSPFLFRFGREILLLARRTLDFGGAYDLGLEGLDNAQRTRIYHRVYWSTPKRTSLWRIDPDTLELLHLADLPGHGDTCFPAVVDEGGGNFRIYNYTSPLDGMDLPWIVGQFGATHIYEVSMTISSSTARPANEITC